MRARAFRVVSVHTKPERVTCVIYAIIDCTISTDAELRILIRASSIGKQVRTARNGAYKLHIYALQMANNNNTLCLSEEKKIFINTSAIIKDAR